MHEWIGTRNVEWFNTPEQPPLDDNEVLWIAKSVCKISRKNLASGQTQQNFSFIQAAKGKRSGEARVSGQQSATRRLWGVCLPVKACEAWRVSLGFGKGPFGVSCRGVRNEPKQDD